MEDDKFFFSSSTSIWCERRGILLEHPPQKNEAFWLKLSHTFVKTKSCVYIFFCHVSDFFLPCSLWILFIYLFESLTSATERATSWLVLTFYMGVSHSQVGTFRLKITSTAWLNFPTFEHILTFITFSNSTHIHLSFIVELLLSTFETTRCLW